MHISSEISACYTVCQTVCACVCACVRACVCVLTRIKPVPVLAAHNPVNFRKLYCHVSM